MEVGSPGAQAGQSVAATRAAEALAVADWRLQTFALYAEVREAAAPGRPLTWLSSDGRQHRLQRPTTATTAPAPARRATAATADVG